MKQPVYAPGQAGWIRELGGTGLQVSAVCLGGGPLGSMPGLFGRDVSADEGVATGLSPCGPRHGRYLGRGIANSEGVFKYSPGQTRRRPLLSVRNRRTPLAEF